jgi:hypothetical protein
MKLSLPLSSSPSPSISSPNPSSTRAALALPPLAALASLARRLRSSPRRSRRYRLACSPPLLVTVPRSICCQEVACLCSSPRRARSTARRSLVTAPHSICCQEVARLRSSPRRARSAARRSLVTASSPPCCPKAPPEPLLLVVPSTSR